MNDARKDEKDDKRVWPPLPEQTQNPTPEPRRGEQENAWGHLLFAVYLPAALILVLGLSAAYASYHFHLMHIIQAAHAQRAFAFGVNVVLSVMAIAVAIVAGVRVVLSLRYHARHR